MELTPAYRLTGLRANRLTDMATRSWLPVEMITYGGIILVREMRPALLLYKFDGPRLNQIPDKRKRRFQLRIIDFLQYGL